MKLSSITLAMLPLSGIFASQAAVYNVTDIGMSDKVRSTYAAALNDNGHALVNGTGIFNFPIDLEAIDFESDAIKLLLTEEQIAAAQNGTVDTTVQTLLFSYINSNQGVNTIQKVGSSLALQKASNTDLTLVPLRGADNLSNTEQLYAVNNQNIAVGVATTPFSKQEFTTTPDPEDEDAEAVTSTLWVPAQQSLAGVIVRNEQATIIPAPYQAFGGGVTVARAISENNLIAGYGSTGLPESTQETIEEVCLGNTLPVELCHYSYRGRYIQRAMIWQLQDSGGVSEPQVYGFLGEKNSGEEQSDENYTIIYSSEAKAVNQAGIAVGISTYSDSSRSSCYNYDSIYGICYQWGPYNNAHASLFYEGEVKPLVDQQEWGSSDAVAINSDNIVTGYALKNINSGTRSKFFYHDYNTGNTVFPDDFFSSSSSVAHDINDHGFIVGSGEVMVSGSQSRRQRAFIYDINANTFTDLNTQIGCNLPYTLVEANAINNNGEILATALIQREARDVKGNPVLDSSGNAVMEDVTTVVRLDPIANGQPESCDNDDNGNSSGGYEREGASFGWLSLLLSVGLFFRRKR